MGGSIPLSLLVDFIIQKTYHDLSVLSELLHMKTDLERKIEIYNFSSNALLRFTRLLALIKWASKNLGVVDKSSSIIRFLDKQAGIFEQTANTLFEMKEKLANAKIPYAQVPFLSFFKLFISFNICFHFLGACCCRNNGDRNICSLPTWNQNKTHPSRTNNSSREEKHIPQTKSG